VSLLSFNFCYRKPAVSKKEKKGFLKQMFEMANIVQQQRLQNKELENLLSDSQRQALHLSEDLSKQHENPPADPWDKFVASEVTRIYYTIAQGRRSDSLGIYADLSKFLLEVNCVVGSIFKLCQYYSKAHLYLKEIFVKEHPTPSNVAATDSPPSFPKGDLRPRPSPQGNREEIYSRPAC
jgi:hypothetical protein